MKLKRLLPLSLLFLFSFNNFNVVEATNNGEDTPKLQYNDVQDIASYNNTYYPDIESLTGNDLLVKIATGMESAHRYYNSYKEVKGGNALSDEDPNNPDNWIMFYSGISIKNTWDGNNINREHVWCKSHSDGLFAKTPENIKNAGADIHNLRPAFAVPNSTRSNFPFGEVEHTEANRFTFNQPYTQELIVTNNYYIRGVVWEPRDEIKGDIARILFYMHTHYSTDYLASGSVGRSAMRLEDITNTNTKEEAIELLLRWSKFDPVDDFELKRNEVIGLMEGVRNPFIDYPELADLGFTPDLVTSYSALEPLKGNSSTYNVKLNDSLNLDINKPDYCTYTSSDPQIVSIDKDGNITGNKLGNCVIEVKSGVETINLEVNVVEKLNTNTEEGFKTYNLTNYSSGSIKSEDRVLDDMITLKTTKARYYDNELRLYNSNTYPSEVKTNILTKPISEVNFSLGNNLTSIDVYGLLKDGEEVLVNTISLTSTSQTNYNVNFDNDSNIYYGFKLKHTTPGEGKTVYFNKFEIKYAQNKKQENINNMIGASIDAALSYDLNITKEEDKFNKEVLYPTLGSTMIEQISQNANLSQSSLGFYSDGSLKYDSSNDKLNIKLNKGIISPVKLSLNISHNKSTSGDSITPSSLLITSYLGSNEVETFEAITELGGSASFNYEFTNLNIDLITISLIKNNGNVKLSKLEVSYTSNTHSLTYSNFQNVSMKFRLNYDFTKVNNSNVEYGILLVKNANINNYKNINELETLPNNPDERVKNIVIDPQFYNKDSYIVEISNIPLTSLEEQILVVGYLKYDGLYYFSSPRQESVYSLLEAYSKLNDTVMLGDNNCQISSMSQSFIEEYNAKKGGN